MNGKVLKIFVLLLSIMITLSLFGCTSVKTTKDEEGSKQQVQEQEKKEITLKCFAVAGPYTKGDFNDLKIWKEYEKISGIKVIFESAISTAASEKVGLMFASNNLPDFFFKYSMSKTDLAKYSTEGLIIAIDPYLKEYAPNFSKYLAEDPSISKNIRMTDGKIYSFAYLVTAAPARISPKLFVNNEWLKKSGVNMPRTTDDLYNALIAFRDSDFNGNGKKDEIGVSGEYTIQVYRAFYGAFGLMTRGAAQDKWDIDEEKNELRFIPTSDRYKEYLQYLNKLYTEKLLDQEIFTIDIAKFTAKAQQKQVGFAFIHNNNYLGDYKDDYITLPAPLIGPHGDQLYSARTIPVAGLTAQITNVNKYPAETVKWIDYFYSEDGIRLYFMGIEGETYYIDENGNPQFTDYVTKNPDGLNMEEALGRYVAWSGGGNPSVADDKHFGNHLIPKITVDGANALIPYTPKEIWGSFTYTPEESTQLSVLQQDIDTYVDDMRAKFITGEVSFDTWNAYVANIEKMGLSEYRKIVQTALDRYNQFD
ncbi:MAG: extracellular solute-binding protein [Firmicutes bacterium]|nr:extracellular solute-binding protein [Bacillota bacterium]